jgi:hypothetical protein
LFIPTADGQLQRSVRPLTAHFTVRCAVTVSSASLAVSVTVQVPAAYV